MDIFDILSIEGIVIRLIPKKTTSLYTYREGQKLNSNQKVIIKDDRKFISEYNQNSLHGYAITIQKNQSAQVVFSKKVSGFGDSIENAYKDYLYKNKET